MQVSHYQRGPLRELNAAELDAVGGAWSIGSSGDGGLSFELGNYSGTVWGDGAAISTSRNGQWVQTRYYRW